MINVFPASTLATLLAGLAVATMLSGGAMDVVWFEIDPEWLIVLFAASAVSILFGEGKDTKARHAHLGGMVEYHRRDSNEVVNAINMVPSVYATALVAFLPRPASLGYAETNTSDGLVQAGS